MHPSDYDQLERLRYQRRIEHLHRLGPRSTGELLAEVAGSIGGWPVINRLLVEYEQRPRPPRRRQGVAR
jgi:hypothetical protein